MSTDLEQDISPTSVDSGKAPASRDEVPEPRHPRRNRRVAIVGVLIISLLLAAGTRMWAERLRHDPNDVAGGATSTTSLANMNSFALALLLGGLRGPLVMFLWINSEEQKNEKNLQDFDTYVEWIRLLQPEFDTVHIFQVWNKAYNISVQMASNSNKYTTILDALDYAQKVLAQRPSDLNMIYQIGSIYMDKLGGSAEKAYYKRRVLKETQPHSMRQKLARTDPGWRRLELDPVLDAHGMILPELLKPKYDRPADLPPGSEWNNGSELQYLEPYQPFPYGVSALALGYNYLKRAQVLQSVGNQVHANLSAQVVDSRPALALKAWSEDLWEQGRRIEAKALNVEMPPEGNDNRRDLELPTAAISVDAPISDKALLPQAIFDYNRSARLCSDAIKEYERHLKTYTANIGNYQSHMAGLRAQQPMVEGDRDYLKAMLASGDQRQKLLQSAAEHYRDSIQKNIYIVLRYYVPESMEQEIFPPGVTRDNLEKLPPDRYLPSYAAALEMISHAQYDPDAEDRSDYERYIDRALARLKQIPGSGPTTVPVVPIPTTAKSK
jgi:hypothetical protein